MQSRYAHTSVVLLPSFFPQRGLVRDEGKEEGNDSLDSFEMKK
jgi:hypothetical protein